MKLKNEINDKLKQAMRDKNAELLNVLRSILSKITESEKKGSTSVELTDDEILKLIEKLAKQREESIALFKQGGRNDLVMIEEFQLNVLKEYLPQKMTIEETTVAVQKAITEGVDNIGSLMKALNVYGNLIDKKLASEISKTLL